MKLWQPHLDHPKTIVTTHGVYVGLADSAVSAINIIRAHNAEVIDEARRSLSDAAKLRKLVTGR